MQKKLLFITLTVAVIFMLLTAVGCDKLDQINKLLSPEEAAAKLGTNYSITYTSCDSGEYNDVTFMRDGQSFMIFTEEFCEIFDATTKKVYYIDTINKQYTSTDLTDDQIAANSDVDLYTGILYSFGVFALLFEDKGSAEVADRDCTKYSYTDNGTESVFYIDNELGILMKIEEITGGTTVSTLEVTSLVASGVTISNFLTGFPTDYTLVGELNPSDNTPEFSALVITVNNETGVASGSHAVTYTVNNNAAYITSGVTFSVSVKDSSNNNVAVNESDYFTVAAGETYTVTITASKSGETDKTATYTVAASSSGESEAPDFNNLVISVTNETNIPAGSHQITYSVNNKQAYIDSGVTFLFSVRDQNETIIDADLEGYFTVVAGNSYTVTISAHKPGCTSKYVPYTVAAEAAQRISCPAYDSYNDYYDAMFMSTTGAGLINNISIAAVSRSDVADENGALSSYNDLSSEMSQNLGIALQALEALEQYFNDDFEEGTNKNISESNGVYTIDFLYNNGSYLYVYAYEVIVEYDESTDSMKLSAYYPESLNEPVDYCTLEFNLQYIKEGSDYVSWIYYPDDIEENETQTYSLLKLQGSASSGKISENRQFQGSPVELFKGTASEGYVLNTDDRIFELNDDTLDYTDNLVSAVYNEYMAQLLKIEEILGSVNAICEDDGEDDSYDAYGGIDAILSALYNAETAVNWIKTIEQKQYRGIWDGEPETYYHDNNNYAFDIGEDDETGYEVYYNSENNYFQFSESYNGVMTVCVMFARQSNGSYAISAVNQYESEDEYGDPIQLNNLYDLLYDGVEGNLAISEDADYWNSLSEGQDVTGFPTGDEFYIIHESYVTMMK
jgi:hypothetical protein